MHKFRAKDARRLVNRDDALILEIGCNDGEDTQQFLEEFPLIRLHCFDCEPRAIAKWKRRIRSPNAILHELALSDQDGVFTFHQSGGTPPGKQWEGVDWDMSGSLLPVDQHDKNTPWLDFSRTVQVRCTTLDAWAAEFLQPDHVIDFVWIDVQGAEGMVIRGGTKTIQRVRYFFGECDPRPNYHGQASLAELDGLLDGFQRLDEYDQFNFLWRNTRLT